MRQGTISTGIEKGSVYASSHTKSSFLHLKHISRRSFKKEILHYCDHYHHALISVPEYKENKPFAGTQLYHKKKLSLQIFSCLVWPLHLSFHPPEQPKPLTTEKQISFKIQQASGSVTRKDINMTCLFLCKKFCDKL